MGEHGEIDKTRYLCKRQGKTCCTHFVSDNAIFIKWSLVEGITGQHRADGVYASEIGKTVFLTREEAEAALKGETNETNPV